MKHSIKKIITIMLVVSILPISVFSASPQTKHMIQNTLSKYCIPNDKTLCNTPYEGKYDPNLSFCLCNDGMTYNANGRKCEECNPGTYYKQNMKDNSCKSCSPGTYQDKKGQSSCLSCNSNNCETSGSGATSCYSRCGGGTPYCNGSGSCVECRSSSDCSGRYSCSNGHCVCDISCSCGRSSSGCSCKSCPRREKDNDRDSRRKSGDKGSNKKSDFKGVDFGLRRTERFVRDQFRKNNSGKK